MNSVLRTLGQLGFFCALSLFASRSLASGFGPAPQERGRYLTCPSGKVVLSSDYENLLRSFTDEHYRWSAMKGEDFGGMNADPKKVSVNDIDAQLLIRKSTSASEETKVIIDRLIKSSLVTPNSYLAAGYKDPGYKEGVLFVFKNSEGKQLTVERRNHVYSFLYDSEGKKFRLDRHHGWSAPSGISCLSNSDHILLRVVERLDIRTEDEYGDSVELPVLYMIINMRLKTQDPPAALSPSPSF